MIPLDDMQEIKGNWTPSPPQSAPSKREALLLSCIEIVTKDRNTSYGDPEDNFENITDLWNAYISQAGLRSRPLKPHDIAVMMILMKVARLTHDPSNRDSWEDIAGYAACGWDCV